MKLLILCCALLVPSLWAGAPELAAELLAVRSTGQPWPLVSSRGIASLREAYAIQREVVVRQGGGIVGYKAGLTTHSMRERFKVEEPVFGVLRRENLQASGDPIQKDSFHLAKLEMEVAFILAGPVTGRLDSVDSLKPLILAVAPAVEIPDLAFADASVVTGPDLIAVNIAAHRFLLGQERLPGDVNLPDVNPVLRRGGEELLRGRWHETEGNPWQNLLWLVNKALEEGYAPKREDVFLTGALGGMAPVERGRHEADFGSLGRIPFLVE